MDPQLNANIEKANTALARAGNELNQIEAAQTRIDNCSKQTLDLVARIATSDRARLNLHKLCMQANYLGDAYARNGLNLSNNVADSNRLMDINTALSVCYLAVAVGKVMDVVASLTGEGKVVTSLKNSFLDMAEGMGWMDPKKKDLMQAGAHAANITLMMAGSEVTEFVKGFDDFQKAFNAILGLIKDVRAVWKLNDVPTVLASFRHATPQVVELFAKCASIASRLVTLWALVQPKMEKLPINLITGKMVGKPQLAGVRIENLKGMADSLNAIRFGLEAAAATWKMVCSYMDMLENGAASRQASKLAFAQLTATGGGKINLELDMIAGWTDADIVTAMHGLDSAPDALGVSRAGLVRSKQLLAESEEMRHKQVTLAAGMKSAGDDLTASRARLQTIDSELQAIRKTLSPDAQYNMSDAEIRKVLGEVAAIDTARTRITAAGGALNGTH